MSFAFFIMAFNPMVILHVIIAFLVLMFMVTIHEAGHYTVGKLLGFKINEFAIGMGPKLFSRKLKSGEVFSIRAFPLGGFCAFEGEDKEGETEGSFNSQKPWKRILTLIAGATFNFVSAILIVIIAFSVYGNSMPQIAKVYENSPAEKCEIQAGDIIYSIDGKKILIFNDVSEYIGSIPQGESFDMVVIRDGEKVTITGLTSGKYTAIDEKLDENGNPVLDENGNIVMESQEAQGIGIRFGQTDRIRMSFGEAVTTSVPYCMRAGFYVWDALANLVTGQGSIDDVGGPITTISTMTQIAATGFDNILFLIVLISVNLAIFNLLPIPALDGARVVFVAIEWIRGKPIDRELEGKIHFIGLILLFALVILIDLIKIF